MKRLLLAVTLTTLFNTNTATALDTLYTLWTRVLDLAGDNRIASVQCQGTDIFAGGLLADDAGPETNQNNYVARFSGDGRLLWESILDLDNYQAGGQIAVGPDQSPYLGLVAGQDPMLTVLAKFNASGETLWTRVEDRALPSAITADESNNCYILGSTGPGPMPSDSLWLVRYSPNGNRDWHRVFYLGATHNTGHICRTSGDELVATLQVITDTDLLLAVLVKISTEGDTLWTKWFSQGFALEFEALAAGPANTFYAILNGTTGRKLAKFSSRGDTLWTTELELPHSVSSLAVDSSGSSFVAYYTTDMNRNFELNKYSPDGEFLATGTAGSQVSQRPYYLAVGSDGNPVVGGFSTRTYIQGFLAKFHGTSSTVLEPTAERPLNPARLLGTVINGSRLDWQIQRAANYRFSVFDAAGRQVLGRDATVDAGRYSLPLPELAAGVYIVRLETGSSAFTEKFVVQR